MERNLQSPRSSSTLSPEDGGCAACTGKATSGSGKPVGVDCRCGRHFHFGEAFWLRTDLCIICPSCSRALSPLDFDHNGQEKQQIASDVGDYGKHRIALDVAVDERVARLKAKHDREIARLRDEMTAAEGRALLRAQEIGGMLDLLGRIAHHLRNLPASKESDDITLAAECETWVEALGDA